MIRAASLTAALALSSAQAWGQDIQTDFDRSFGFARLKTYAYAEQRRASNDPLEANPINDRRVRAALDSQLAALGYRLETGGKPDFLVAYHAAARNKIGLQDWGYGPGRWGSRRIDVNEYVEGTLVVDFVDAARRELIWRGSATGTIEPKEAEKKIPKAVAKLIGQYSKDTKPRA
jgi:hypothetical protein